MSGYEMQALDFLKKAETQCHISRIGEVEGFPFDDHDKLWHYKYLITLTRHKKQYRFTFYDSFANWKANKRPSKYDVLACVDKYEVPMNVEDFAAEYGYDINEDYKKVCKIHTKCREQYERLLDLFGEELMAQLCEIN